MIKIIVLVLISGLTLVTGLQSTKACPCQPESLCRPVNVGNRPEVIGFTVYQNAWLHYNWTYLTTLVLDEVQLKNVDPHLLCYAHARNVRLLALVQFPEAAIENETLQQSWTVETIQMVADKHLDGINIDTEKYYPINSLKAKKHVDFINRTTIAFHAIFPGSLVTYDAGYIDNCEQNSCSDSITIASVVDFIMTMNYDENGRKYAYSNSPYYNTVKGIKSYLNAGINPQKLVVIQPWYGYDYKCIIPPGADYCIIKEDSALASTNNATKPKRRISKFPFIIPSDDWKVDPNQASITYGAICNRLRNHNNTRKWNPVTKTPYFNYKRNTGEIHQVCYDDAESMRLKSDYIFSMKIRGIGVWTVDFTDYTNFPKESAALWQSLTFGLEKMP
ncbi:expressed hypothetical protein [Trichoplax adhaerens]|uniref:GH18 domain-containing protein n=1 Tax=Trichoplax adhaerens TaxID=10228 RepID=B3RWQ6_TRIAD|nr:expressed hypothetical protein [Trichoplax adhaerens]EDV24738.1 expressed hypothetical protein [Trichoplax adhaerens]|eukprot:XP_002112628.1 expressed hypothetical protein [Trichoplax adhaerens]